MGIFLVSVIKWSQVGGGIDFPVKQKLSSNQLWDFISQNKRKKNIIFVPMLNWFHIQLLKKRERNWGRGAQRKKIISGDFFDGGNPTGKLEFSKDMHRGKQFPFPPPIQVVKQRMVKPRSILFLSSVAALLPRERRGFHDVLVILWGLATPLRSSSTRGQWIVARNPAIFSQKENASFFSSLNTLSFIATIILTKPTPHFHCCCFPCVISLQKGLLKVNSGDLHSGTVLEVDTYSLQPVQLGPVLAAVQPEHCMVTQSAKRRSRPQGCCELSLPCPEVGLLQGCTWHHWKGKQPILMETISGRKVVSSAAVAADQLFGDGCITSTSQIQLGQLFSSLTPLCQKMQHFTNSFISILFWMELYPNWSVFPQNKGQLFFVLWLSFLPLRTWLQSSGARDALTPWDDCSMYSGALMP